MIDMDALIFDVDGTLVDSRDGIIKGVNLTLEKLGVASKDGNFILSHIGTGVKDLIRNILGEENIALYTQALEELSGYYRQNPGSGARLYPNVEDVLKHYGGKRKFVLSNRQKWFAEKTLAALGIDGYFEEILGGEGDRPIKPTNNPLDTTKNARGISKDRVMIVGDMSVDIETGKLSGMKTCWVTYGLGRKEDILPLEPDFIINDISELKDIVRK